MKVIRAFLLGGAGGLALALAVAIGLYASPVRKGLYLDFDPEISALRGKLGEVREKVMTHEMGIAEGEAAVRDEGAARKPVDSLKTAQAGAWKEYRHWRNRLGELSRAHDTPKPGEFASWAYSLRYGFAPLALASALVPGLLLSLRRLRGSRSPKPPKAKPRAKGTPGAHGTPGADGAPGPQAPQSEALSSFQAAVKQVARIARTPSAPAGVPGAATVADPPVEPRKTPPRAEPAPTGPRGRDQQPEKETEYLPEVPRRIPVTPPRASELPAAARPVPEADFSGLESSPYEVPSENVFREEPETASLPLTGEGPERAAGLETQIMKLGPEGWGEARRAPAPPPQAPERPAPQRGLSMEDEDVGAGEGGEGEAESAGVMPPTTEVERVERRKDEVVKLARKGMTSSEISRRMRISQDQVEFIIRMRREKG